MGEVVTGLSIVAGRSSFTAATAVKGDNVGNPENKIWGGNVGNVWVGKL